LFPRTPLQPSHGGGNNNFAAMAQGVGFWIAVGVVFISGTRIWRFSQGLAEQFFYDEFGSGLTFYLSFPLAFIIAMIVLYMARMSLATSIAVFLLWAISKLPIF
jgi:uncharacterized membrane protein YjjP (DUF1212 family)